MFTKGRLNGYALVRSKEVEVKFGQKGRSKVGGSKYRKGRRYENGRSAENVELMRTRLNILTQVANICHNWHAEG